MKFLARVESDCIRWNAMKKGSRQMVSVANKLYRTDDRIQIKDCKSADAVVFYPVDSTQPIMPYPVFIDPDTTIAYMDSAKQSGNKKSIWMNLTPSHLMEYLGVATVVLVLIYSFLLHGGA